MSCSQSWSGQLLVVVDSSQWRDAKPLQVRRTQEWILSHNSVIYISGTWLRKRQRRGKRKSWRAGRTAVVSSGTHKSSGYVDKSYRRQTSQHPRLMTNNLQVPSFSEAWLEIENCWERKNLSFLKMWPLAGFFASVDDATLHHIWATLTNLVLFLKKTVTAKENKTRSWERGMLEARGKT